MCHLKIKSALFLEDLKIKSALLCVNVEEIYHIKEGKVMTEHIHKRFTDEQVRMILGRYVKRELSSEQAMNLLRLKRRQFFKLIKRYKESHDGFTIEYSRKWGNRKIGFRVEENIIKELEIERALIDDPTMPVSFYNYSFIKDELKRKYGQEVSLPTIIDRAKKKAFTSQDLRGRYMTER